MIPNFLAVGVIAFSTMAFSAETLEAQEFTSAKALDCQDPANYGQSLAHLKQCRERNRGFFGFFASETEGATGYMTCLDEGLRRSLIEDMAEAIDSEDQSKIRSADQALETLRAYCETIETDIAGVTSDLTAEATRQVAGITDVLWSRLWHPEFIGYLLDPKGLYRGYFDTDIWNTISLQIGESYDAQWFYDQEAIVSVTNVAGDLTRERAEIWKYRGTADLRLLLDDGRIDERTVSVEYTMAAAPAYVSDVNLAGFYLVEADVELGTTFDAFYKRFPVLSENEKP